MNDANPLITDLNSGALQKTFEFYQNIITRMADNSRNCKTWCLTLVSAIAVWTFRVEQPCLLQFALLPSLMLWFLDAYYLHQERGFRTRYNALVEKLHEDGLTQDQLYVIRTGKLDARAHSRWSDAPQSFLRMFDSPSTLPFYGLITALLIFLLAMKS